MANDRRWPVLDLFAGMGTWTLVLETLPGFYTIGFSEVEPYAVALLQHHWPDIPQLGAIQGITRDRVLRECGELPIVVTGSFPCQPHSTAGKRLASEDERDLWAECGRVLRELRPRVALFENVAGLLSSESGLFFNRVLSDLAEIGYACSWETLSAADVGAPHRRERVWLVCVDELADSHGQQRGAGRGQPDTGADGWDNVGGNGPQTVADPAGERAGGRSGVRGTERGPRRALLGEPGAAGEEGVNQVDTFGLGGRGGDDKRQDAGDVVASGAADLRGWPAAHGLWPARPGEAQYEWEYPRTVTGETFPTLGEPVDGIAERVGGVAVQVQESQEGTMNRTHQLKALGNGIVPACAYPFAVAIRDYLDGAL